MIIILQLLIKDRKNISLDKLSMKKIKRRATYIIARLRNITDFKFHLYIT